MKSINLTRKISALSVLLLSILLTVASPSLASDQWTQMSNGSAKLQKLGSDFAVDVPVHKVEGARLVLFNYALAKDLGLDVPENFDELERTILDRFGYMVANPAQSVDKMWQASYYQDSSQRKPGDPLGDGRALWTGQINELIDVQVKGIGQTPLAWFNHSIEAHRDGLQSIREAVHSFVVSELNYSNQLNSTGDLAVIEVPQIKKDYSGRSEKAAITVRVGEHLRVAHLRYWADHPENFKKIFDLSVQQTLSLSENKTVTDEDRQLYLDRFATNIADEAARYFDLHAVHGSPTAGNRTTSGATIDLGTFRYLDAHHSEYTYLFDKMSVGGSHGQTEQLREYIEFLAGYANSAGFKLDWQSSSHKFDLEFKNRLTELWLRRLGLTDEQIARLSSESKLNFFNVMKTIHEAVASEEIEVGKRKLKPAQYKPRQIFKEAWRVLLAPNLNQTITATKILISSSTTKLNFFEKVKLIRSARLLAVSLKSIERDLSLSRSDEETLLAKTSEIGDRDPLGSEFGQSREKVLLEKIQAGAENGEELSHLAAQIAKAQVDKSPSKNLIRELGKAAVPVTAPSCRMIFMRAAG